MMRKLALVSIALGVSAPCLVFGNPPPGPCDELVVACQSAGFVKGDYREGFGLYTDCVDPLMRGITQPHKAVKPLPAISPEVVAACRQQHPNFGEGKKHAPPPPPPPPAQ